MLSWLLSSIISWQHKSITHFSNISILTTGYHTITHITQTLHWVICKQMWRKCTDSFKQPFSRYSWVCWLPPFFSHPYPEHPHRHAKTLGTHMVLWVVPHPLTLTAVSESQESCVGNANIIFVLRLQCLLWDFNKQPLLTCQNNWYQQLLHNNKFIKPEINSAVGSSRCRKLLHTEMYGAKIHINWS